MSAFEKAISLRLRPEVYEAVDKIAKEKETSKGTIIRQAINHYIKNQ